MFLESEAVPPVVSTAPIPLSELDYALTAQILVAWAGERADGGSSSRLAWWESLLVCEFGGMHVFGRTTPQTAQWAVLQAVREVARRADASLRAQEHDPDSLRSLYNFGFEIDERIDERLLDLKRSGKSPSESLPGLAEFIGNDWDRAAFSTWAGSFGPIEFLPVPSGRRIKSALPPTLEETIAALLAGLVPLTATYPMPHFRVAT
ncbi:MAG: BREX-6 system BrxE protein [Lysobacterales bacterium]